MVAGGGAWKVLRSEVASILPGNLDEFKNESLWWSSFLPLIGAGFCKLRAAQLHNQGMRCVRDAMTGNRFSTHEKAEMRGNLLEAKRGA